MSSDLSNFVTWSFPTRVIFGEGSSAQCAAESRALSASRVLIVSDAGIEKAGLLEPVEQALSKADIAHSRYLNVSSNPLEAEVLEAAEEFCAFNADLVIGVGGGSVLDVAKLVRVGTTHPLPLSLYDDAEGGSERIVSPLPPMIAIPTTAGTGSEVGRSAVVTLGASNRKTVIFAPQLIPDVAILDPVMTATMPAGMVAATGMDALTHCVEAYCSVGDHPLADAIALGGIALCQSSLQAAVQDASDLQARGDMLKAAMMGAVAFQKGLGACHSLAHPLSTEWGLHHGLANAICLPPVLDFNRAAVPARIARIARELGVRANDDETLAFECAGAVRALRKAVGLPSDLSSQGVLEAELPKLGALAYADGCHQLNPRPCSEEDLLQLYRACLHA